MMTEPKPLPHVEITVTELPSVGFTTDGRVWIDPDRTGRRSVLSLDQGVAFFDGVVGSLSCAAHSTGRSRARIVGRMLGSVLLESAFEGPRCAAELADGIREGCARAWSVGFDPEFASAALRRAADALDAVVTSQKPVEAKR